MTDTDRIREAQDAANTLGDAGYFTTARIIRGLVARLEAAEAVARAARQYLDTGRGDLDGALEAWERSQETGG